MSKGEATKERIVERAVQLASRDGLGGLSIGALAEDLGLSKSGLFAHFGSKEDLQLEVLQNAAERFRTTVIVEALRAPRGRPRVEKLFELWLRWHQDPGMPGGCIFAAAAMELDDHPGPVRDYLVSSQQQLTTALAQAVRLAIAEGHFRADVEPYTFAFELFGILFAYTYAKRLHGDNQAETRAHASFQRLIDWASNPS
jgi:AcrR family transcriptional regulator